MLQDDVVKDIISKQIEEIERQHIGMKDMQTMSEMTSISKMKGLPQRPKEYQYQDDRIDE